MTQFDSTIVSLNRANNAVSSANQIVYNLPIPFECANYEVCLSSAFIYNSVNNISNSIYNNAVFQYTYPDGAGFNTYTVTMPDGFYDVDIGINGYLQDIMLQNGTYLLDSTGAPVFFISVNSNIIYYRNTIAFTPVPTVAEMTTLGYTTPSGSSIVPPASAVSGTVKILSNGFSTLFGFTPGTYPTTGPYPFAINVTGDLVPQLSPQYVFNICGNFVNTAFINKVPTSFYTFSFTQPFGYQEVLKPYQYEWFSMTDNVYNQLVINIFDQSGQPALLQDLDIQVNIFIRRKSQLLK